MDPDVPPLSASLDVASSVPPLALDLSFVLMLGFFLLLLLASAVFSGSEVALFSLSSTDKEKLAQAKDRASQRVLRLIGKPRHVLITILLLNNFVNVAAAILAALMTGQMAHELGLQPTGVFILEAIVLTFVLLVVSEITPKLIATQYATTYSRRVSRLLLVLHTLLYPVTWIFAQLSQRMSSLFHNYSSRHLSSDDVKAMVEIGEAHGTINEEERELIHSIIEFGDTAVREIMISRLDIVALPVTATVSEALELIRTSGHSRMPLFVDHLDNIPGIVYAKDLLPFLNTSNGIQHIDWTRLMRPPMFVPQGRKLDDLLNDFQREKMHMAIVVDEYGGTAGMVTLEDVLEEIVGDIRDEHDEPEAALYTQLTDGSYRVDARIDLDDLNDLTGLNLDTDSFDFETLGGLIFHLTGEIPSQGDNVSYGRLTLLVESVDHNRIGQVHVWVAPLTDNESPSDTHLA